MCHGKVEIMMFNPPYVPTPDDEVLIYSIACMIDFVRPRRECRCKAAESRPRGRVESTAG
jgi:hypothetical protein